MRFRYLAALTFLAGLAGTAQAHMPQIQDKMRTLGLDVGNAYACTPDDQKEAFRGQLRHLYMHVLEDHGPDAAYDYATSVGFGASRDVTTIDCDKLVSYWEQVKSDLGL